MDSFNSYFESHHFFTLDTVKEAAACYREENQKVLRDFSFHKNVFNNNSELDFVADIYLVNGLRICEAVEKCYSISQKSQQIYDLVEAGLTFKEKVNEGDEDNIGELKLLKESFDLLTKDFVLFFKMVKQRQLSLLENLRHIEHTIKQTLEEKMSRILKWKKWSIVAYLLSPAIFIIILVLILMIPKPIMSLILAAISPVFVTFDKFLDFTWNTQKENTEREMTVISVLKTGTSIGMEYMKCIKNMVHMLEDQMSSLSKNGEVKFSYEKAVLSVIEEIQKIAESSKNLKADFLLY